jgi:hypothetical protein
MLYMASRLVFVSVVLRTALKWPRKVARHFRVKVVIEVSVMIIVWTGQCGRQIFCLQVRDVQILIHIWAYRNAYSLRLLDYKEHVQRLGGNKRQQRAHETPYPLTLSKRRIGTRTDFLSLTQHEKLQLLVA